MEKIKTFWQEKVNFFQSLIKNKNYSFYFKQPINLIVIFLFILTSAVLIFNLTNEEKIMPLKESDRGIIGGSLNKNLAFIDKNIVQPVAAASLDKPINTPTAISTPNDKNEIYYLINNNSLQNPNPILTGAKADQNGILIYKVQKGDTLSSIAAEFGISSNTIRWANNLNNQITPGEELIILPVSGVIYEVKAGDTLESIAKNYSASVDKIMAYNNLNSSTVLPLGQKLIIPDGKINTKQKTVLTDKSSSLPNYPYYYVIPTTGFNWGTLHSNNGVDIANRCGTSVMAAAEGLVISIGWDPNGYGNYIKIQHPNNTETLYGHLNKVLAKEGDYINQGQQIGLMGNTGYVIGTPGCHLHFEVHGAKNPFIK